MQTVGEILKAARVEKKLTLTDLSRLTKIPKSTLQFLEKNRFSCLPSAPYIRGFIRNYSQVVNLDPEKMVAFFKRDYLRSKTKPLLPQGYIKPINLPWFKTPSGINLILGFFVGFILLFYLSFMVYRLYQPPKLIITTPENGQTLRSPVLIKGKTDRDASLTLNDKFINLEPDGSFTTVYQGSPGTAELKFISRSRRQKQTTLIRYVIITP